MTHEAIALHDDLPKGRKSGTLKITDTELAFYAEDKRLFSLPIRDLEITQGGTGNRYVYFNHPDRKGYTIYTDDKKILKHDALKRHDSHTKSVRKIKNNRRLLWLSAYSILGVVAAMIILFFVFRGAIVEQVAHAIPVTWEQEVSSSMLESATVGKKVVSDQNIIDQLNKITTPLVDAVEDKDFKFSFTIIEDPTLNAYALPGGAIVIHSGLISQADNVNEVAGVLAHEISHVTRRHHIRGLVDKLGMFMLIRAFLGDATFVAELSAYGATLEALKYSRDYELEADDSGWNLMLKANLDPNGMIDFFEKLQHEHGSMPDVASFMSTHPATSERIEVLEAKPLNGKSFDEIDIDFEQFKKDIELYFEVN